MTAVLFAARVVVISTSSADRSGAEEWKRAAEVARRRRACSGRRRVVCREDACAVLVLLRAQREIIFPLSAHPLCRWGARAHSCVPVRAWEHRHSRRRPAATTTCRFVLGARQPLCENTRSRWPAPIFLCAPWTQDFLRKEQQALGGEADFFGGDAAPAAASVRSRCLFVFARFIFVVSPRTLRRTW